MFPSDTAGWIGFSAATVAILVIVAIALALIIENTKVLNEEKALRVELDDIQREADNIGPNPSDEQVAALQTRVNQYRQRFEVFRRSPFVISR